jgi:hypothetical protein
MMGKAKSARMRRQAREASAGKTAADKPSLTSFKIGEHAFRIFTDLDAAFGANESDYPPYESIPIEHRRGGLYADIFGKLFFNGGKLSDHNLKLRDDVNSASFYTALRALMSSFAPKHEVKEATVAWFLAEYTVPA